MATVPPTNPDRINPQVPPERTPPAPGTTPGEPPEIQPVPPDIDEPDVAPEELPPK